MIAIYSKLLRERDDPVSVANQALHMLHAVIERIETRGESATDERAHLEALRVALENYTPCCATCQ